MVEYQALDRVFHALADPTRRDMLHRLSAGEHSVGALAAPLQMSLAAASKHVKVLEGAGLVRRRISGRTHLCRLDPAPLAEIGAWLRFYQHFWDQSLEALDAALRAEAAGEGADPDPSDTHHKGETP